MDREPLAQRIQTVIRQCPSDRAGEAVAAMLEEQYLLMPKRTETRDRAVVPLVAGGQIVIHGSDRADAGWTYLEIVGSIAPDSDGVATLAESERRTLAAILDPDLARDAPAGEEES